MKLVLSIKNNRGEYITKIKQVNDKKHAENYELLLIRKGIKIIGSEIIK